MSKKILSASENMSHEYCATVVRIGDIHPLEDSDRLEKTLISGNSFVIEKGTLKTGELAFYVENECEICEQFLHINNQYELPEFERNANADEVRVIIENAKAIKEESKSKEKSLKPLKKILRRLNEKHTLVSEIENLKKYISDNEVEYSKYETEANEETSTDVETFITKYKKAVTDVAKKENRLTTYKDVFNKNLETVQAEYDAIVKEIDATKDKYNEVIAPAKAKCGYFNKHSRVRMIRLRGCPSYGYLFGIDAMRQFCPQIDSINLEDYVDQDFDTVNVNGEDVLFCKAYIPPVKETRSRGHKDSRQKKTTKFNRMIPGEWNFHYDTQKLQKNMHNFNKTDVVDITVKEHGTSFIAGNVKVKNPKEFHTPFASVNKWLQKMYLKYVPVKWQSYTVSYGNVCSSRSVIKNSEYNPEVQQGYYKVDVWTEMNNIIKDFIPEGTTIYGEIVGYLSGTESMIQKEYDYGCEVGTNKLMPYRIVSTDNEGRKYEWTVSDVYEWTIKLMSDHPEIADRITPIEILYHGTLVDLYPNINSETNTHWHDDVLEALKVDARFHMEMNEPLCTGHTVPREGIVLRKVVDGYSPEAQEAYKLKTDMFFEREKAEIDAGNVDIEMSVTDYNGESDDASEEVIGETC